jgi:monoamine oxidase
MTDKWIKGCYAGVFPPQILSHYGSELRTPFQHIHWAGTETSVHFMGYMEGAVLSGERAANEVLSSIGSS